MVINVLKIEVRASFLVLGLESGIDFSTVSDSSLFSRRELPACRRDLARLNGYVTDEAQAFDIAAKRKVAEAGGFSRFDRGRRRRLRVSKRKKVRDGFNVRTRLAE